MMAFGELSQAKVNGRPLWLTISAVDCSLFKRFIVHPKGVLYRLRFYRKHAIYGD